MKNIIQPLKFLCDSKIEFFLLDEESLISIDDSWLLRDENNLITFDDFNILYDNSIKVDLFVMSSL